MKKRCIAGLLTLLTLLSFSAHPSLADIPVPTPIPTPTCNPTGGGSGIPTAIGCINITDFGSLFTWILPWGIGIAGGISFLLILYSAFLITTSAGDPKKLQAGQEQLTAAITGLLLVIFSVFILKVIGINIFNLPGFFP